MRSSAVLEHPGVQASETGKQADNKENSAELGVVLFRVWRAVGLNLRSLRMRFGLVGIQVAGFRLVALGMRTFRL